jgi:hypothetical protein
VIAVEKHATRLKITPPVSSRVSIPLCHYLRFCHWPWNSCILHKIDNACCICSRKDAKHSRDDDGHVGRDLFPAIFNRRGCKSPIRSRLASSQFTMRLGMTDEWSSKVLHHVSHCGSLANPLYSMDQSRLYLSSIPYLCWEIIYFAMRLESDSILHW